MKTSSASQWLVHCTVKSLVVWAGAASVAKSEEAAPANKKETQAPRTYEDKSRGFRVAVPKDWSTVPVSYSVQHYRDVFLCINSKANKALRVVNERKGNTERYNAETVAAQLEPGTVYIDLAIFDGPGGSINFEGKPDTVNKDLGPILKESAPTKVAGGKLSKLEVSFIKREHRWHLYAFFREPVKPEMRAQAEEILRSFRFIDE